MPDLSSTTKAASERRAETDDRTLTAIWEGTAGIEDAEDRIRAVLDRVGSGNPSHIKNRLSALGLADGTKGYERGITEGYSVDPTEAPGEDATATLTADGYARKVLAGEIVACSNVAAACRRHLADHDRDDVFFDYETERRFLDFARSQVILEDGTLLRFHDWQVFVTASLLGWRRRVVMPDGREIVEAKYDRAYIETGKSSGKTPLVGVVAAWVFITERDRAAEIYFAATNLEQARIAFNDFAWMIRRNRRLSKRISVLGGNPPNRVRFDGRQTFAQMLAQKVEGRGLSGRRPNLVVADEVHEWHDSRGESMIRQIENSLTKRPNALLLIITNSGEHQRGVCWDYHNRAIDTVHGRRDDDGMFSFVCSLDDGDDYSDPAVWPKTNPSLPMRPRQDKLAKLFRESVGDIKKVRAFRRYYACQWLSDSSPFLSMDVVDGCLPKPPTDDEGRPLEDTLSPPEERRNARLFFGIDLGETADFTALSRLWLMPDGKIEAAVDMWTPKDTLPDRELADNAPYARMVRNGHLRTTPGGYVLWGEVAKHLKGLITAHGWERVYGMAYDPYKFAEFDKCAFKEGLNLADLPVGGTHLFSAPHPQSAIMKKSRHPDIPTLYTPISLDVLEQWLRDGRIRIRWNPMLRRAFEGVKVTYARHGGRLFTKVDQPARIDSFASLVFGAGLLNGYETALIKEGPLGGRRAP